METTKLATFDAPMTISRRAAQAQEVFMQVAPVKIEAEPKRAAPATASAKPAAAPLISSDDLMAGLASVLSPDLVPSSREDKDGTPELERTQRIEPTAASAERTQRVDPTSTQPFHPERTQRMQSEPEPAPPEPPADPSQEPTRTQRLDASIQKLQEAKRLLQGVTQKP
jgi:hypothetical protein